jgi:hypothetical protein
MSATALAAVDELDAEPTEPSDLELGLITNARRRQRRRRVGILSLVLLGGLAGLFVGSIGWQPGSRGGGAPAPRSIVAHEPAGMAFAQPPYMGVACHVPNWTGCDRVGLAVWLRGPATVTASLAGKTITLNDPTWSYVARRGQLYVYAGFLRPARPTSSLGAFLGSKANNSWLGANAPSPLVRFRIEYRTGGVVSTQEHVFLSAGWG